VKNTKTEDRRIGSHSDGMEAMSPPADGVSLGSPTSPFEYRTG